MLQFWWAQGGGGDMWVHAWWFVQAVSGAFGGKFDRAQVRDRYWGQAMVASRRKGRWDAEEDTKLREVSPAVAWRRSAGVGCLVVG